MILLFYLYLPVELPLLVALHRNFMIVSAFVPSKNLHVPPKYVQHQPTAAFINSDKQVPDLFFNGVCFSVDNDNNDGENVEGNSKNTYLQDKWKEMKSESIEREFLVLLKRTLVELDLKDNLEEIEQLLLIWNLFRINLKRMNSEMWVMNI